MITYKDQIVKLVHKNKLNMQQLSSEEQEQIKYLYLNEKQSLLDIYEGIMVASFKPVKDAFYDNSPTKFELAGKAVIEEINEIIEDGVNEDLEWGAFLRNE